MSHSDLAISEQQKEEFFQEMRNSADYKFGFCRSTINTAIWMLEKGYVKQALSELRFTASLMEGK